MTSDFMKELLSKDEKITVEYKNCQYGIQEDVYETVCSFSNRYGGYIIMGVEDDGTPIGINRNMSKDMRKNFVNQLNNPDRMSPTLYLSIEEFEYETNCNTIDQKREEHTSFEEISSLYLKTKNCCQI